MRIAKIKCPHCGGDVTVRDTGTVRVVILSEAQSRQIWKAFDEACSAMDKAWDRLDRLFRGLLK